MCGILRTIETRCECRWKKYKWNYSETRIQTDNQSVKIPRENVVSYIHHEGNSEEEMIHLRHYCLPSENKKIEERKKKRFDTTRNAQYKFIHTSFVFFLSLAAYSLLSLFLALKCLSKQKEEKIEKENERFVLSLSLSLSFFSHFISLHQ